jgi:CRISPR-associated protein Cmr2
MVHDIFALWDENKTRMSDIPDIYYKSKYLLTRNPIDARKTHQSLIGEYKFPDMSDYIPSNEILSSLPAFSFFLQFTFTLATPYLSKDDEEFYIIDNPIKKDKVFKVPIVSGSTWKGNMRWTAMKSYSDGLPEKANENNISECLGNRAQMIRLFGHEKGAIENYLYNILTEIICNEEEKKDPAQFTAKREFIKKEFQKLLRDKGYLSGNMEGRRGRLNFYPTFFNRIGLEVINPHDRKTKAGTLPIYIESVPTGSTGMFSLLYVPFDLIGKPIKQTREEVIADMDVISEALREMMTTYGFSAKKSSGFGIITDDIQGTFEMAGHPIYKENETAGHGVDSSSPFAKLKQIKFSDESKKIKDNEFKGFTELKSLIDRVKKAVDKNAE